MCHRRSDRAQACLESLEKSDLRGWDVTVFIDGPASPAQVAEIEAVREVAREYCNRNHWVIIEAEQNAGLRFATPNAVQNRLAAGFEWVLTLEDDVEVGSQIGSLVEELIEKRHSSSEPAHYSLIDLVADEVSYSPTAYESPIPDSHAWLANRCAIELYEDHLEIPYRAMLKADLSKLTVLRLTQLLLMVKLSVIESWAFRYTACLLRYGVRTDVIRGGVTSSLQTGGSNTFLADRKGANTKQIGRIDSIRSLNKRRFSASLGRVMLFAPELILQTARRWAKIIKASAFQRHPDLSRILQKGPAYLLREVVRYSRRTIMMKSFALVLPKASRSTEFVGSAGSRWPVPATEFGDIGQGWTCISLGLGTDVEVEEYLFRNGWKLELFDPTPGVNDWIQKFHPELEDFVIPKAVADFNGSAEFFAPADNDQISHSLLRRGSNTEVSVEVNVVDIAEIISTESAEQTFLKMDVEGVEMQIIERLAQVRQWPRWIAFEIDEPLSFKKMRIIRQELTVAGYRFLASANSNFLFERNVSNS